MNSETVGHDALLLSPAHPDQPAAVAVDVRCGQGIDGLAALRDDWQTLLKALPDVRFQHQYAWYLCYLRNLETDPASVHFFSFFRDGRPVAIIALRRTARTVAGLRLRVWELPFNPHMNLCDALIARDEDGGALIARLIHALGQHGRSWDALHLPNLLDDSTALRALRHRPAHRLHLERKGSSMYFPCPDIDTALSTTTRQFQRNLRRLRKKLDQRGEITIALVRDPAALTDAVAEFIRVEGSGWKGDRGSAIRFDPALVAFYRDLADEFGADGRCQIALLKLDGRVIAAQFGLLAEGRLNLLKIAYDETFAAEAPGHQLLREILGACSASPAIGELSLVTGPAWAASRWNPNAHSVWHAHVFNTTPRGLAAYALSRLRGPLGKAKRRLSGLLGDAQAAPAEAPHTLKEEPPP